MIQCSYPLAQYKSNQKEILESISKILESGNYILGNETVEFEKRFAEYCETNYAVGVNSGTDALILSLKALNIGKGDEVITVSHTALATVAAIIATGATPVLVDIEKDFFTIDPSRISSSINSKTKAIIIVHLYGQPADIESVLKIAKANNIFLIEDCAQATGALYNNRRVGSFGDIGCFSFYPTKNLGAIGDGGMVVSNNKNLIEKVQKIRQYGWDLNRNTNEPGINSRLDEIQAAILNVKLKNLDEDNSKRKFLAERYYNNIKNPAIRLPKVRENVKHVYHLFVILSENRDVLISKLHKNNIIAGIHYPVPVHKHDGYKNLCIISKEGLFVTEEIVSKILSLPMYPELKNIELDHILSII